MQYKQIVEAIKQLELDYPLPTAGLKRFTWDFRRRKLRDRLATQSPEDFLLWPTVREAIFSSVTPDVVRDYEYLSTSDWRFAAIDPPIGGTCMLEPGALLQNGSSGTYIRQAVGAQRLATYTGRAPSEWQTIFEFGGGYGAFHVVASRMGWKGLHTIMDLPEMHLLQKWYLSRVGANMHRLRFKTDAILNAVHTSIPEFDIFIAFCSLDESPERLRASVLRHIKARHYLIWYTPAMMKDGDWFERFFMDELGVRTIQIETGNKSQVMFYADRYSAYGSK